MVNNMSKVFKLIIDDGNEPIILEEDEVLEDILNHLESISNRIDDIQFSLIKYRKPLVILNHPFFIAFSTGVFISDYSLVIAPVVADLCTTPVALSAPPNSYQNNSQS